MKRFRFQSFIVGFLILILTISAFAQTPELVQLGTIQIIKNNKKEWLSDLLTKDDNKNFLLLLKDEVITLQINNLKVSDEFTLTSDNTDSVGVINNSKLIGLKENTQSKIKINQIVNKTTGEKKVFAEFDVRVEPESLNKITSDTTFLTYKAVRDNFGKRIAESFLVVQVVITNKSPTSQFYMQEVNVMLDPMQCAKVQNYYNEIKPFKTESERKSEIEQLKKALENGQVNLPPKDNSYYTKCIKFFDDNFHVPTALAPIKNEQILGMGEAYTNLSKRKIGFSALRFVADMGSVLTGMKLLGSDGIKGFNFLGTNIFGAADSAIPNTTGTKFENLRKSLPNEKIIVKSRDYETINLFIPIEKILSNSSWLHYKKSIKDKDENNEAQRLKSMMELFIVSSVNGILITDEAPKVTTKPGGGANNLDIFTNP